MTSSSSRGTSLIIPFSSWSSTFFIIEKIFSNMFEKLNVQNFHCDVCEYARNHRVSFSLSNKKSFVSFSLIHMDVWGPTKVHSILG